MKEQEIIEDAEKQVAKITEAVKVSSDLLSHGIEPTMVFFYDVPKIVLVCKSVNGLHDIRKNLTKVFKDSQDKFVMTWISGDSALWAWKLKSWPVQIWLEVEKSRYRFIDHELEQTGEIT